MRIIDVAYHGIDSLDPHQLAASLESPATLEVPAGMPAVEAATMAEEQNARLILATEDGEVRGIVAPSSAVRTISHFRGSSAQKLSDALSEMLEDPAEAARGFHHEGLNMVAPELFVCPVGPHYTDESPCPFHNR
jgi:hypothetical protein